MHWIHGAWTKDERNGLHWKGNSRVHRCTETTGGRPRGPFQLIYLAQRFKSFSYPSTMHFAAELPSLYKPKASKRSRLLAGCRQVHQRCRSCGAGTWTSSLTQYMHTHKQMQHFHNPLWLKTADSLAQVSKLKSAQARRRRKPTLSRRKSQVTERWVDAKTVTTSVG